jgi:3,4-dihydroxy-2-butanone 4-phosphate synthase
MSREHITTPGHVFPLVARDGGTLVRAGHTEIAMITGADEAIAAHQRVAEAQWRESLKGAAAATRVRQLIAQHQVG